MLQVERDAREPVRLPAPLPAQQQPRRPVQVPRCRCELRVVREAHDRVRRDPARVLDACAPLLAPAVVRVEAALAEERARGAVLVRRELVEVPQCGLAFSRAHHAAP